MAEKNPYSLSTAEGLIFANIESARLEAVAWAADSERYAAKAQEARAKMDRFQTALDKLKSSK